MSIIVYDSYINIVRPYMTRILKEIVYPTGWTKIERKINREHSIRKFMGIPR